MPIRNTVLRVLLSPLRLFVACLTLLMGLMLPASAADLAERVIIGYSPDGRYFAFEQFGIQDGSGFAYSEVFLIDLVTDSWVPGTPVRVRAEDESDQLFAIRAEAMAQAGPHLASLNLSAPYRTLASTTPMEAGGQETELGFYPRPILPPIDPLLTLHLSRFALPSPNDCYGFVEPHGFALSLRVGEGAAETIYRDTALPRSRVCPERYGLSDVIVPFDGAPGRAVALISVYQLGFEGLDRRFLAVPFDLPF